MTAMSGKAIQPLDPLPGIQEHCQETVGNHPSCWPIIRVLYCFNRLVGLVHWHPKASKHVRPRSFSRPLSLQHNTFIGIHAWRFMFEYHNGRIPQLACICGKPHRPCYSTPAVGNLRTASPLGRGLAIEVSTSLAVRSELYTSASTRSTRPYIITHLDHLCSRFVCYRILHFGQADMPRLPNDQRMYTTFGHVGF